MNCTPASLVQASRCFCGMRRSDVNRSFLYALCQWANVSCLNSFIVDPPPPIARVDGAAETLGFRFQVSADKRVTRLGRYYVAGNNQNHLIRLWANTGPVSLADGTILAASPSDARGFKWVDVSPVTLVAGTGYTIGITENAAGDAWKDSWAVAGFIDPSITNVQACFVVASDSFPFNLVTVGETYTTPALCLSDTTATDFTWTPAATAINWTDGAGLHTTDLHTFISIADIATVTTIECNGLGITAFSNLSHLPALNSLQCGGNAGMVALNVSGCTALTQLVCDNDTITSLNVTGCTSLSVLNCTFNIVLTGITGINTCTALTNIDCSFNQINSLNVGGATLLNILNCSDNNLGTLTVSHLAPLVNLYAANNPSLNLVVV